MARYHYPESYGQQQAYHISSLLLSTLQMLPEEDHRRHNTNQTASEPLCRPVTINIYILDQINSVHGDSNLCYRQIQIQILWVLNIGTDAILYHCFKYMYVDTVIIIFCLEGFPLPDHS